MFSRAQKEIIVGVQQAIATDVDASRRVSLTLNSSLTSVESALAAQETILNRTLSMLIGDCAAFSDSLRNFVSRPPSALASSEPQGQSPRSRLAATFDDLGRFSAEFRRQLSTFGGVERSIWKRLISDELTRRFYERLRGDVATFSVHQLRQLIQRSSPGGGSGTATTSSEWPSNYQPDDGIDDELSSVEGRHALLNADVPALDMTYIDDQVTRELAHFADAVGVDRTLKVKVEDLLTQFDDMTNNVESLKSDCGNALSDNDVTDLIR